MPWQISVVEVPPEGPKDIDPKHRFIRYAEEGQGDGLGGFVDQGLKPVEVEISDPVETIDRVVNFVEFPEKRPLVKGDMGASLHEFGDHQEDQAVEPQRPVCPDVGFGMKAPGLQHSDGLNKDQI